MKGKKKRLMEGRDKRKRRSEREIGKEGMREEREGENEETERRMDESRERGREREIDGREEQEKEE